jgi:DNA-3-methyladenine glycosylase I
MTLNLKRCGWVTANELYICYHDHDWGVPVHSDQKLFEMLILEGAQADLSWLTILKKREGYRAAFAQFDATNTKSDKTHHKLLRSSLRSSRT